MGLVVPLLFSDKAGKVIGVLGGDAAMDFFRQSPSYRSSIWKVAGPTGRHNQTILGGGHVVVGHMIYLDEHKEKRKEIVF